MKVIPQFFDPFSPWKLHVRYLTRRYYPEQYRSLSFYGIFAISASFTEYMREKYVNIYRHMYICIYYTSIYILVNICTVNTYTVYMYMNIFMYCVYIYKKICIYLCRCIDMGVPRWEWADEGGEIGVGIWELGEGSGEMGVGRWWWGDGGGEMVVGRW